MILEQEEIFSRVMARKHIREGLQAGKSWQEIKRTTRDFLAKTAEPLKGRLQTEEFIVSPEMALVAEELSQYIRNHFPNLGEASVVLLGSGSNGGSAIRKALGVPLAADLDWAVTYDNPQNLNPVEVDKVFRDVTSQIDQILPEVSTKHLGFALESCDKLNPNPNVLPNHPVTLPARVENLHSAQEALTLLKEVESYPRIGKRIMFLLPPSHPAELNQESLIHLILAVKEWATRDPDTCSIALRTIRMWWDDMYRIKAKHFGEEPSSRTRDLASDFEISQYKAYFLPQTSMELLQVAFDEATNTNNNP